MKTKLLHIGMSKCGSTALQLNIFPEISKILDIPYINLHNFINNKKFLFHILEKENNLEKKLPEKFIISNEGLFSLGWQFNRINKSFKFIKKNFSRDTIILLIIRNPYELLSSIYIQKSIHELNLIREDKFFYINNDTQIEKNDIGFNLYNFDYNLLIKLYKSYFNKVIVIKHENLHTLTFLKEIFNLDDNSIINFKKKINKYHNKSISKTGIKFILYLSEFLDLKKIDNVFRSRINGKTKNIFIRLKDKFYYQFLIREFFQEKFDKIFPYNKFKLNKDYIPIDINKLEKEYNKIK